MLKIKNSSGLLVAVLCFLLAVVSVRSIANSSYLWIYVLFFFSFAALIVGFLLYNKAALFKILFFFIPLSVAVGIVGEAQIQIPTEPLIGLLTLMFLFYAVRLKKELRTLIKNPIALFLLIELLWMVVCSITSEITIVSFKYTLVRFSYMVTFFVLGYFWMKQEERPYKFHILYAVGMILPIINGFIFHAKLGFTQRTAYIMPQPFYNDHTVYGACLAFLIPALIIILFGVKQFHLNTFQRFLILLLLILFLVAEYLSFSRAAWLSLVCSLILFVFIKLRMTGRTAITLLIVGGTVLFFNFNAIQSQLEDKTAISNKEDLGDQVMSITNSKTDISNKERVNRWKCAIRMGKAKPIFGFGPRTYKFFYGTFQAAEDLTYTSTYKGNKGHSHSDYLSYFAESGYIGFVIHLLLYLVILYQGLNTIRNSSSKQNRTLAMMALLGLITYFIHGIFNGFMDDEKMASLVYMSMAILVYTREKDQLKETKNQGNQNVFTKQTP